MNKLPKECLLIEKLIADEPDALQRKPHSIANADDWNFGGKKKKVEKSILMNYKYALAKYMIWKYYAKAPNIITF